LSFGFEWTEREPQWQRKTQNSKASLTLLLGPYIVAGVLKKFIPQRPGQAPSVEEAGSWENPLPPLAAEQLTQPPTPVMDTPNKNNLSKDVEIKGSIKFVTEFVFDGNLEGEISSVDGVLTVGENADVRGEVKSKTVIVKGKVHGNITVQERCELHSRSQLIGDLKAARLVIEEGATFVGKSEVTPNKGIIKELGIPHKEEPQRIGAPR
jgi:cytoskeletal protein CcmA (bactofilin family)